MIRLTYMEPTSHEKFVKMALQAETPSSYIAESVRAGQLENEDQITLIEVIIFRIKN